MRQIKFRAWFEDEMLSHEDLVYKDQETHAMYTIITNEKREDGIHFMQYTGLKDKNGREIYEGDIIEIEYIEDEVKTLHQVVWGGNEYPAWDVKPYWDGECNVFSDIYCSGYYKMKVIGNIYENPELLEVPQ